MPGPSALPLVSFIIIARNASQHLPDSLSNIAAQDYPKDRIELLLVDGCSQDGSRRIMEEFAAVHPDLRVIVLDNPGRILSCGWNVALAEAKGDIIIRVDAHSKIPTDFIKSNVHSMLKGECIVGGPVISKMAKSLWENLLVTAERSKFGGAAAAFRNSGTSKHVDTLAYAAYKRTVFEKVGGYDERLVRNQDNEIHYRMKQAGFKFFFDPAIRSFHIPRSSLYGLLRQKYGNGLWIGLAMGIQPRCFGMRHFAPALFVGAMVLFFMVGILRSWVPLVLLSVLYSLAAVVFTVEAIAQSPLLVKPFCLLLPVIFLSMHGVYGIGTMIGFIRAPFFMWKNRNYELPWPIKPSDRVTPIRGRG
ncbi:MAG: glycosyltransferase family 2 protein [bacterium]